MTSRTVLTTLALCLVTATAGCNERPQTQKSPDCDTEVRAFREHQRSLRNLDKTRMARAWACYDTEKTYDCIERHGIAVEECSMGGRRCAQSFRAGGGDTHYRWCCVTPEAE